MKNEGSGEAVSSFLDLARSVGTVFSIQSLDSDNLQRAFSDVGRMEGYNYQEIRRQTHELSPPIWNVARLLFLLWLTLLATLFHPAAHSQKSKAAVS